jgi:hypothetical protein
MSPAHRRRTNNGAWVPLAPSQGERVRVRGQAKRLTGDAGIRHRTNYRLIRTRPAADLANTSGAYMSSATAPGMAKSPGVTARTT